MHGGKQCAMYCMCGGAVVVVVVVVCFIYSVLNVTALESEESCHC